MKRKTESYVGSRPIFTGSPAIVPGGFNLDKAKQNFAVDDVIPAGTLAIMDEEKRTVQVIKTAKVVSVAEDNVTVTLKVGEFAAPCFAVGDHVAKAPVSGQFSAAPEIKKVEYDGQNSYVIVLAAQISTLAPEDVLVEVVNGSTDAKERGLANCVTFHDIVVGEFETPVDVCQDTMQYAMFERRVMPIPASQKNGDYLKGAPHVRLTKSC